MVILKNSITKEALFSTIPQEEIFERYLGQTEQINKRLVYNTIRGESSPSVSFKYYGDILYAKDFADWEFQGDCVNWAKLYYKYVKGELYTEIEILNKITDDFAVDIMSPTIYSFTRAKKPDSEYQYSKIQIEARLKDDQLNYSLQDKKYWMQFGISTDMLPAFGVISCKKVWITNLENKVEFYSNTKTTKDLIFAYRYGEGQYKIYQPLAEKSKKWRSNLGANKVDDISLSTTLKTTHIFYDNDFKSKDNPGQKAAKLFLDKFNLKNIRIPNKYACTDISEFRVLYGKEKTAEFLQNHIGSPENSLILTKSRKDRIVLHTFGYQSYALQNEGILPDSLPY